VRIDFGDDQPAQRSCVEVVVLLERQPAANGSQAAVEAIESQS
jgi:hypothetical protein